MLLLYIVWDDWPIFMITRSNEQLHQELEYTLLKPDCHSWWISKMQSDTLEERYAIKFCFKLGKNAIETYGVLQTAFGPSCMNRASVFEWHKGFKEGRESVSSEAVVMRQLRRWKRLWGRSLTRSHKRISMGPPRSCRTVQQSHCSRRRLLRSGLELHLCTINESAHTKKVWKHIVYTSYLNRIWY